MVGVSIFSHRMNVILIPTSLCAGRSKKTGRGLAHWFKAMSVVLLFVTVFRSHAMGHDERTLFAAPFTNQTGESTFDHAVIGFGDLLGALLSSHESVSLVERMSREAVDAERRLQASGLIGEEHDIALARELMADTVLIGHLFRNEKNILGLSIKAIDIETERVVAVDSEIIPNSNFDEALESLTNRFAEKIQITLPKIYNPELDERPFASLYFGKGLSCYYSGNLDAAIMNFTRALNLDPHYIEAHYFSGLAYQQLKEPRHAAIEWKHLIQKRPGFPLSEEESRLLKENFQ